MCATAVKATLIMNVPMRCTVDTTLCYSCFTGIVMTSNGLISFNFLKKVFQLLTEVNNNYKRYHLKLRKGIKILTNVVGKIKLDLPFSLAPVPAVTFMTILPIAASSDMLAW